VKDLVAVYKKRELGNYQNVAMVPLPPGAVCTTFLLFAAGAWHTPLFSIARNEITVLINAFGAAKASKTHSLCSLLRYLLYYIN